MKYINAQTGQIGILNGNIITYKDGTSNEIKDYQLHDECFYIALDAHLKKYFQKLEPNYYTLLNIINNNDDIDNTSKVGEIYNLFPAKNQKLIELETAFDNSKRIVIQNGETLEVNNREVFLGILEKVERADDSNTVAHSYQQIQDGKVYEFACIPVALKRVYQKYFFTTRPSGIKEPVRASNKKLYDIYKAKINNATTLEALDLQFNFVNQNGVIILIDETAKEILAENINAEVNQIVQKTIDNGFIQITDV